MRSVDTNVVVCTIVRDDLKQAAAAESFIAKGAWISHLVLAETTWVLRTGYQLSPHDIAKGVQMLLDHEALIVQDPEVVKAALTAFRSRPSLGFSDCLIFEIARRAGHLPLGTFDRALSKLNGAEKIDGKS